MWTMWKPRRIALALQGGGAHGAFAAGVLDRLLETGFAPDRVSGVSSGALLGTMLAQGWASGGADGARAAIVRLWERVAEAHAVSPVQNGPIERWLWGADLSRNPVWQGLETAMRFFGPAQLNPLGHNPLRAVIADLLNPKLLASPAAPRLTVGVTDVETGKAVLFRNEEITVEVLLASSCLPFIFPAVEINGRVCWDGAYSGNPPLAPLLEPNLPDELVLIRAQPRHRPGTPTSHGEIFNRINEIAFQSVLERELEALPRTIRVRSYEADEALLGLPISSRLNAEAGFLRALCAAGREAARRQEEGAPPLAAD
ncbi:MAG TPA: patatin-like phospholipase family protein [Acetobacteraceae bacterium]|jgi:NTE family protein|nr:patatin-like phospholipase family protein [Acetobacteraceae bacterium]